jgi:hypothetical protein
LARSVVIGVRLTERHLVDSEVLGEIREQTDERLAIVPVPTTWTILFMRIS